MSKSVEEVRRAAFEAWAVNGLGLTDFRCWGHNQGCNGCDDYQDDAASKALEIWNAALDAVEIQLPTPIGDDHGGCIHDAATHDSAVSDCRAAIEQTGLGLRVL